MAKIIIEVPNEIAAEAVLAISTVRGYQENLGTGELIVGEEINNPQTRAAFIKQTIINELKSDYKRYKINLSRTEEAQVSADADTFIDKIN